MVCVISARHSARSASAFRSSPSLHRVRRVCRSTLHAADCLRAAENGFPLRQNHRAGARAGEEGHFPPHLPRVLAQRGRRPARLRDHRRRAQGHPPRHQAPGLPGPCHAVLDLPREPVCGAALRDPGGDTEEGAAVLLRRGPAVHPRPEGSGGAGARLHGPGLFRDPLFRRAAAHLLARPDCPPVLQATTLPYRDGKVAQRIRGRVFRRRRAPDRAVPREPLDAGGQGRRRGRRQTDRGPDEGRVRAGHDGCLVRGLVDGRPGPQAARLRGAGHLQRRGADLQRQDAQPVRGQRAAHDEHRRRGDTLFGSDPRGQWPVRARPRQLHRLQPRSRGVRDCHLGPAGKPDRVGEAGGPAQEARQCQGGFGGRRGGQEGKDVDEGM